MHRENPFWITTSGNRGLALYLACDLIKHLKNHSESAWPVFMPQVFAALGGKDHDVGCASAYACNLAAKLPSFAQAAPEVFRKLAQIVSGAKPKKRNVTQKLMWDNAVAALLSLAENHAAGCPPELQVWPLILQSLPLKNDEEEAKEVHTKIVDLVLAQHPGLLGQNHANLGQILSVLAEIYKNEGICTKETEQKISNIFKSVPQDHLKSVSAKFSEKQMKKIEKILCS
jgi:hypothetical protein